jgi:1-acyl-sn-glycerol-3-phosphate acyltransferase
MAESEAVGRLAEPAMFRLLYPHDRLDQRSARFVELVTKTLLPLYDLWFKNPEVRGLENVPDGSALYVGNHNGGFLTPDSFLFGCRLMEERGIEHVPFPLTHELILQVPGPNHILVPLGCVVANSENAMTLLTTGKKVLVYPGGDLDAFRPWSRRDEIVFGARRGYIRLALKAGVPISPVVAAGAHEVWRVLSDGRWLAKAVNLRSWGVRSDVFPIALSLPWGLTVGPPITILPFPTKILMEVLPPIHFERHGEEAASDPIYVEACHRRVHSAMQEALTRLAAERRGEPPPRRDAAGTDRAAA